MKTLNLEKYLQPDIDELTLTLCLTEECNLHCVYCYQGDRKKGAIAFETATRIIARYLTREDRFRKIVIEFIGGEALLYFDLIRDIFYWTAEHIDRWKKPFHFFIDTNGTLLTEDKKDWFIKNRKYVTLGLSLDGTPEVHDSNRCNSYERIRPHLSFFAQTWPGQSAKMTISPASIPMLYESILHVTELGFLISANTPMEDIWGPREQKRTLVDIYRKQIRKLVKWFTEHPEANLPSLIDLPIHSITEMDENRSWCGCGRNMVSFDVNGQMIPCSRFARMSFDHALFELPILPAVSPCNNCLFKPACQTCEANNWQTHRNPNVPTSFHCEFVKLQIWGTAQMHLVRLRKKLSELQQSPDRSDARITDEAILVHKHLKTVLFVLEQFEKHEDLEKVGRIEGDSPYPVMPLKPLWSVDNLPMI
jgi:uncharacterized protein